MRNTSRFEAFRDYVSGAQFVCTIGAAQARKNELEIVALPEEAEGQCSVSLETVRRLVRSGRGAAVALLYPHEPTSYEELRRMHTEVHASVFAACMVEDATIAGRKGSMRLPRSGEDIPEALFPFVALASRKKIDGAFVAYDAARLVEDFRLPVARNPQDSIAAIRHAARSLLGIDGNIAPCVDGEVLQAIVMSPVFDGDLSDRIRALLPHMGMRCMAHGRYAPATAMIINHSRAVLDAAKSQQGAIIRQRMMSGASAYRYDPMHVLAEQPDERRWYQRLQQAGKVLGGMQ